MTLLWDTLAEHSCTTLLWESLVGHSSGTLVGHSCLSLLWNTLVGHSCRTLLWDTLVGHSCRTKFMRQSSKASVSYETSSRSHMSKSHDSLRLPRNFPYPHVAHKVLGLPRNVTSITPRNLTIPCACHENRTSTPQSPHKILRLPRKVTISYHVSFNKICTTPHYTFGMTSARSEHTPVHQNRHFS